MSRPDPIIISAVIITYKRLGHLKECLESIYAHTPHVKCQDLTPDPTPQNDEWEMVVIVNG
ncbi:MAG: glycosyltransferase, partial [Elusimicrobia bacterium]|nr:glycosyltransferase [Elusimicrobiota bacterium]